jgi:cytochrome c553
MEEELSMIDTPEYARQYIIHVIDHGSHTLGFKGGVMEGGFAAHEDASKIACYVLEMSGKQCRKPYPEDAGMFYTSICGGCHGNDGRGLGGNYPDLTRKKLLGIERREAFLKMKIKKSKKKD